MTKRDPRPYLGTNRRLRHRATLGNRALCGRQNCDMFYEDEDVNCPECRRRMERPAERVKGAA